MATEGTSAVCVLVREQCDEYLRANEFGRLAVSGDDGPLIFPMNYVYDGTSIILRTAEGTKLASAPMTMVAFEIDGISHDGNERWSVVVRGQAHDVTTAVDEYSEQTRTLNVDAWAPGRKPRVLRITAHEVSGRSFATRPQRLSDVMQA